MTVVTPLSNGAECIKMTLTDGQDEVRIHLHVYDDGWADTMGMLIKNASRGVLYEEGDVIGDCQ